MSTRSIPRLRKIKVSSGNVLSSFVVVFIVVVVVEVVLIVVVVVVVDVVEAEVGVALTSLEITLSPFSFIAVIT